ncbi:60S ribosomal protein L23a [Tupaia chinensis]|uniref:60S ribosomal protein L23a n=1 Tax=Tupaia chinensis TaxID=246437 RepID=L9L847_TUPCH|nr:60S ribosomal protein L23a [Tupaia chinensis]
MPKAKKEAPAPPKAEAKTKALKAKMTVLKGIHSHTHTDLHITHLPEAHNTTALEAAQISLEEHPKRNKPDLYAIFKFPLTESAVQKMEDSSTLVFSVEVKASKHQITQAVKLCDTDVAEVSTLLGPDGEKACI